MDLHERIRSGFRRFCFFPKAKKVLKILRNHLHRLASELYPSILHLINGHQPSLAHRDPLPYRYVGIAMVKGRDARDFIT